MKLREHIIDELDNFNHKIKHVSAYQDTADKIRSLFPQWIPVEDRLPEDFQIVLWWHIESGMVEFGSAGSFNGETVTHWMPLPKAP